jgi:hypothetical protein
MKPRRGVRASPSHQAADLSAAHTGNFSERADPKGGGNEKSAHANHRNDILNKIGHPSLLYLDCS